MLALINNPNIDWNGVCKFDEDGKIVEFTATSVSNHHGMKPIPKSTKLIADANQADRVLASVMQAATRNDIAVAVKKLSLHCGMQAKAANEVESMFMDYCNDLAEYPKSLIDGACESYRRQPEGNNFMPSSGKLISLMASKYGKMKFLRGRIDKILGKSTRTETRGNKTVSLMDALDNLN